MQNLMRMFGAAAKDPLGMQALMKEEGKFSLKDQVQSPAAHVLILNKRMSARPVVIHLRFSDTHVIFFSNCPCK